jgi:hypothetical protein
VEAITPAEPERVKAPPVDVLACERPPVRVMAAATVLLALTAAVAGDVKFTAPATELVADTEVAPQVDITTAPVTHIPVLLTRVMSSMLATVTLTNGLMAVPIELMISVSPAPAPPSISAKVVRVIAPRAVLAAKVSSPRLLSMISTAVQARATRLALPL